MRQSASAILFLQDIPFLGVVGALEVLDSEVGQETGDDHENNGEPEGGCLETELEDSILASVKLEHVGEGEASEEVEDERSPYGEMSEEHPVHRFEGKTKRDDEDGHRHHVKTHVLRSNVSSSLCDRRCGIERSKGEPKDDCGVVDCIGEPTEETTELERLVDLVDLRILLDDRFVQILLEESQEEDGHGGQEDVEDHHHPLVVERLCREAIEEAIIELREECGCVLVDGVVNDLGVAQKTESAVDGK